MCRFYFGEMVARTLSVIQIVPEMDEGGVEGETLDLAQDLVRRGHRSIVISAGGRMVAALEKSGVEHLLWPNIGSKNFSCLPYIGKLREFILKEKIDILHLRSRLPAWVGWLAWKSLKQSQRPGLLTTFHGFYSINSYSAIMTKGQKVVAVSRSIKEHIEKNYPIDPSLIEVIYGGVDNKLFSPENVGMDRVDALRTQWGLGHDGVPVLLLPGRLTRLKGQDIFLNALAQLKDINFKAICVGDIPQNAYVQSLLHKIEENGLGDKVRFVGHCDDMPAAFYLSDIVVSASSTHPEAFGKIAIEAMSMSKPVVATAHGGSLEIVLPGETGWLVPPLDSSVMADALQEAILNKGEREARGVCGRKRVIENFTIEVMCDRTVEIYQHLIELKEKNIWK